MTSFLIIPHSLSTTLNNQTEFDGHLFHSFNKLFLQLKQISEQTDQYPCPWEADILVVGEEINIRNGQIIRNVIS